MGLTREDFTRAVLAYQRDMYRAARAMLPCDALLTCGVTVLLMLCASRHSPRSLDRHHLSISSLATVRIAIVVPPFRQS